MSKIFALGCAGFLLTALLPDPAAAWARAGRFGGYASGGGGSWQAHSAWGGSAYGGGGSWDARGRDGGTASGGDGSWHGNSAWGGSASGGGGSWNASGRDGGTASGGDGSWSAKSNWGGTASGGGGSWNAQGADGGTASGGGGSWHAQGNDGGTASGGDGSWHADGAYGGTAQGGGGSWTATSPYGATAYHNDNYYGGAYSTYHPPTTVNYYNNTCGGCGGWGAAGAAGPLAPFPDMANVQNMHEITPKAKYDMTTFDEVLVKSSSEFMDRAKKDGKPFFVWHNTTRMHVWTFLSPKYRALMNNKSNYGLEEAGMTQMDDSIGALLKHVEDIGETDNTIVVFTTDNGAEVFSWPDGGMTPFKSTKGTVMEGGFRVPAIIRWPGKVKPGTVENGIFSGLDWLPTLAAAAGNPDIAEQLLQGVKLGGRTYKNHLDGFNQLDLITGKGSSARHELFYFGGPQLGAIRLDDMKFIFYQQPGGWPGPKTSTDMPMLVNIRQDPFERTPMLLGETSATGAWGYGNEFFGREAWRFVAVQQAALKLAMTAVDYPPMQDPASFNLSAVKAQVEAMIKAHAGK